MRVALAIVAALSFLDVGLCEKITFTGSPAAHANIMVLSSALAKAYKAPSIAKRQVQIEDRGIQIGGAAKDKKKGAGKGQIGGAARNQTAEGLAALEGARQRANGTANAGNGLALGDILSGGSRGDKAAKPAAGKEKAQPAKGEAAAPAKGKRGNAGDVTAVRESEQFKDNSGIIVDKNGRTKNVGGNLGITKGSDGSTSVGGAAGINILSLVDEKDADEAHDTEDAE
ncbi:ras guanine nucleotide exchange factor domain-containing protein [Apiospora arundinis]